MISLHTSRFLSLKWSKVAFIRYCSSTTHSPESRDEIRVRFAPSPTGFLHLGGLRSALYNYLFARHHNGKFIVRIEDTDQKRTIDDAQRTIFDNLAWAGIEPDESAVHGGDFGPYVQSQRLNIYRDNLQQILDNGRAYRCFCSAERLEIVRREAIARNEAQRYDGHCRHLSASEIGERLANGEAHCVRLNLEAETIDSFDDMVYGHCVKEVQHEGDPILIKSDGFPTYHYANVVDDHYMRISHVLRGQEWLTSTTKHLTLYSAFGWKPPKFAHLPLILNEDGTKLSKRYDHARVEHYREQKILPSVLLNYITSAGGGLHREFGDDHALSVFSVDELINRFDLARLSKASKQLHPELCEKWNRVELIRRIQDPQQIVAVVQDVRDLVKRLYPNDVNNLDLSEHHVQSILHWSVKTDRLISLVKLVDGELAFLWILPPIQTDRSTFEWIDELLPKLEHCEFQRKQLVDMLKDFAKERHLKLGNVMKPLRLILGGITQGPGVGDILEILGKESALNRIRRQIQPEKASEQAN